MSTGREFLDRALARVDKAIAAGEAPRGTWTLPQVIEHCAQSLECVVNGFPVQKPWLVRRTVGVLVSRIFIAKGKMSHNVTALIPGLPALSETSPEKARARLAAAIEAFAQKDTLAEHFFFGRLSHEQHAKLQSAHVFDHLP